MVYQVQWNLAFAPSLFSSLTSPFAVFTAANELSSSSWESCSSPFLGRLCSDFPSLYCGYSGCHTACSSWVLTPSVHPVSPPQCISTMSPCGFPLAVITICNCLVQLLASWLCSCPLEYKLARAETTSIFLPQCVPSTSYNVKHVINT